MTTSKSGWLPRVFVSSIVALVGAVPVLMGGNGVYWGQLAVLATYLVLILVAVAAISLSAARSRSAPFLDTARGAATVAMSVGLPAGVVSAVVAGIASADVLLAAGVPVSINPAVAGSWVFAGALVITFCAWAIVAPLTWVLARLLSPRRPQSS